VCFIREAAIAVGGHESAIADERTVTHSGNIYSSETVYSFRKTQNSRSVHGINFKGTLKLSRNETEEMNYNLDNIAPKLRDPY
jgi:hypothetical protein